METKNLADIRRDYSLKQLSEDSVAPDPFAQFALWMDEALASEVAEPTAMTLSTVSAQNSPSSRVVLLKGFSADGFVFYTNYESRKGREIDLNTSVSLNFFWPELERQVNIEGTAARVSSHESEAYFQSRPIESRIGAWASKQSSVLASRGELERRVTELAEEYADGNVPLPPFWGGFRVTPCRFEFWQGRESRLHDRICYVLDGDVWTISRLSP
jgi:pyridoxamine 5'-phosphate oxidase